MAIDLEEALTDVLRPVVQREVRSYLKRILDDNPIHRVLPTVLDEEQGNVCGGCGKRFVDIRAVRIHMTQMINQGRPCGGGDKE